MRDGHAVHDQRRIRERDDIGERLPNRLLLLLQLVDAFDDARHVQDVVLHHRLVHTAHDFGVHGGECEIDAVQKEGGVLRVDSLEGVDKPSLAREGGIVAARSHVAGAAEIEYGRVSLLAGDNGCHDGGYS